MPVIGRQQHGRRSRAWAMLARRRVRTRSRRGGARARAVS